MAVWGLYETEVVDLRVNAKRRDKSDVRSFRRLDRAEASVMGIVDVPDFEACPVPGKSSRTEGRKTTLVGDFRKRVGLVHELGQLARSEERIDDRSESLGIDKVNWAELLAVANVHLLPDGPCHP